MRSRYPGKVRDCANCTATHANDFNIACPYVAATPQKIFVYDGATVNGVAMANAKGRLAEAYTGPSTSKITDLGFSYSARGEVTDTYESTPHSGAYYHVASTYWPNGLLNVLTPNLAGLPNWTYTPDGEGRINTVLASSGQNPVTGTSYNNFSLATGITYGSLDSDSFGYDPNTGRMTQYKFTVNGSALTGNLSWNANGSLRQLAITDPFNAGNTQTCNYTYDDLARLGSTNCGAIFTQNYTYDPFGNIAKSGTISFQPTYNPATNRYSTLPAGTPLYDANGYLDADGFHTYSHDVEGKITQIDSNAVTMTYDALGRWVERGAGDGFTQRVFSPSGREFALLSGQTVATAYVPLPGGALVRYGSAGLDSYWHPDWLGTARLYSNASRAVVNDVAVAPFGEWYVNGPADSFFTGVAQSDAAADMKAFPARDYHTTQGRWLIPDPAGLDAVDLANPQTLNRYAYVMNNPLANVDPMGLAPGTTITIQIPTHCYQTEMTGLPGEWPVCEFTLQQISVGPTNIPGDPGGHPNGPGQAPKSGTCPGGATGAGLTYSPGVRQHIEQRHMYYLSNGAGAGSTIPSYNRNGVNAPASQYMFEPEGTPSANWQLVLQINAKTFSLASPVPSRSNVTFTAPLGPQNIPFPLARPFIGVEYGGWLNIFGLKFPFPALPTDVNTLVTKADCQTVVTSHPGNP